MSDVLAIIQARASSTRLPKKVLRDLHGAPMIMRIIERTKRSRLVSDIVVATSTSDSDNELVSMLRREGIEVRRGPLNDVLTRFISVVDEFTPRNVVRLTGDNPLVDPSIIDMVVEAHTRSGADYTSTSLRRTFPYGLDVECVTASSLGRLSELAQNPDDREHVTIGFHRRSEQFSLFSVEHPTDWSDHRWSVDYLDDFNFVQAVYDELYDADPAFSWLDVLKLVQRRPDIRRMMRDAPQ